MSLFPLLPRLCAVASLCFVMPHALAQGLPQPMLRALARAGIPASAASVIVQPISPSGSTTPPSSLVRHQADVPFNPASVMKLITTYAALDQLGAGFTWKNRVYALGTISNGVLHGNLIFRGSGDPKLVLERIDELMQQIQAKGIREIRGDIVLDRSVFEPVRTDPGDFDDEPLRPYNAAPDGFLLNFKSLIFTFTPDPIAQRVLIRSEPPIAGVDLPAEVASTAGACSDWRQGLHADFSNPERIRFGGRFPIACGERTWPVAYVAPAQYAARVIEAMWRKAGGQLSGSVRDGLVPAHAKLIHTAPSLPLSEIVADINKFSNNLMAQQVFLTLSSQRGSDGAVGNFADSRRIVQSWWQNKFPHIAAPIIDNGSGLSRNERASASAINALLQRALSSPVAHAFFNSLGIAGVDGTVARMRELNSQSKAIGQAYLKTGTLRDVAAMAGYANAQDGMQYSLVAIINHPNAAAARPALDALVEWVVSRDQIQARNAN